MGRACCKDNLIEKIERGQCSDNGGYWIFRGGKAPISSLKIIMTGVNSLNVIGDRVINSRLRENIVNKEQIIVVDGVQHVQIYFI